MSSLKNRLAKLGREKVDNIFDLSKGKESLRDNIEKNIDKTVVSASNKLHYQYIDEDNSVF